MPATSMLSFTANGTPASGSDWSTSRARRTAASRSASAIHTGLNPSASIASKIRSTAAAACSDIDAHRGQILGGRRHRALGAVHELHDTFGVRGAPDFTLHRLEHENPLPRLH